MAETSSCASYLVSVVVTAYNQEAFIEEAVRSVLSQLVLDLECIVVDDGSTDRTPEVLAAIDDSRLRVLRQRNQGVSAARNAGIDAARGEIIAFLDGDDRWRPERLSRDVAVYASEPSVGVMFCNFTRFDEKGSYPADGFTFYPELAGLPSRVVEHLAVSIVETRAFESIVSMTELPSFFSAISVRRSVLGELRFLRRPVAEGRSAFIEDWHLFPLLTRNTSVAYIREPLVELRRHAGNFSAGYENLARAKLGSFKAIRESTLTVSQRRALNRRIARMHADVGHWHVRRREFTAATAAFLRSGWQGRPQSCVKGLLCVLAGWVRPSGEANPS